MIRPIPYLFQAISRQDVPNAPAFDKSKPIKNWVDPHPSSDPVTYNYIGDGGVIKQITMSAQDARTPNLPGHPAYSPFSPVPSAATFNGTIFPVTAIADAQEIAKEVGGDPEAVFDEMAGISGFQIIYPAGDARRAWGVKLANGSSVQASLLIAAKNANGVGAPGHWDTSGSSPVWVSDFADPPAGAQPLAMPVGPIAANEKIVGIGPMGIQKVLESPDPPSTGSATSGGGVLDADSRAIIVRMGAWLSKVGG